jgi:mono/diheme cytochrome c family protein
VTSAGSAVYDVHCGTCHEPTGMGSDDSGPRLAGSLIVQAPDPASLINVILYGPQLPQPAPPVANWKKMDPFGDKLSDDEVAQLASFLRGAWGNKGGEVTTAQVARQR